ncbi:class I SAM-dependent rRNA methyltransferase [bacterium]|nr:class I SAM-dependent rRNA methyltransferase [bacterium]
MSTPPILLLRSGKDRPLRLGHPWVYSGAIRDLDPGLAPGTIVRLRAADGAPLGVGYVNPGCTIAVRLLSRRDEPIDDAFLRRRVGAAVALRRRVVAADTDAYRLINGEGDGLPGILVDRYAGSLVVQILTAGAERLRPLLVAALVEHLRPRTIVERSEGAVRAAEGLAPATGVLAGDPPQEEIVRENGLRFTVVPGAGQKTGHFCDQRRNRARVRQLAEGATVLDAFAYHGGFAVHAGAGGAARVVAVDSSGAAIATAERQWALNHLPLERAAFVAADVGRFLRESDDAFDLLVLDPPALVKQRRDVSRGARAYKDLNLWAMRRARPGALLCTFTCSQHVDAALFRKIVAGAAADAGRAVSLLAHLGPGPDHPVALAHPEGEYLHGLLLQVA